MQKFCGARTLQWIFDTMKHRTDEGVIMKSFTKTGYAFALATILCAPVSAWAGIVAVSVPEPDVFTLVALGVAAVLLVSRARRK
jgi:hypothetical protein